MNARRGVISILRRAFRLFFPRRLDPVLDAELALSEHDQQCARIYEQAVGDSDAFVRNRFHEALRWRHVLDDTGRSNGRLLDLGAGNGAVELAFASAGRLIVGVDPLWNDTARQIHRAAGFPLRRVLASADALPFREGTFAQAVCLETLEHLRHPEKAGSELVRVLEPGSPLLLTTPPRARYLAAPDPHFGIRGLLLLPARMQDRIAVRRGFAGPEHYVNRIYWTVRQIARAFRGTAVDRILSRSRLPRNFFWDAIVLRRTR
jgi:SAM-dependent methyltransferase